MKRILFGLFFLTAVTVFAHDLFLRASPFILDRPGSIQLAMNLAEAFPGKETPWRKDKTIKLWVIGAGLTNEIASEQAKNPSLQLSKEGTYVIGWNASPSYINMDAEEFNEYAQAEGYNEAITKRKAQGRESGPASEKYTRFLKSILQVGKQQTDDYRWPLGQKIEIIPLTNPYSVKPGSALEVKLLFDGQPAAGSRIMATYDSYSTQHDVYAQTIETDSEGKARIQISKNGVWMIRANRMLPLEGDPKAEWQSFWTNCTFEIKQRQ